MWRSGDEFSIQINDASCGRGGKREIKEVKVFLWGFYFSCLEYWSLCLWKTSVNLQETTLSLCLIFVKRLADLFPITFFSPTVRLFSVMWLQYRKFWSGNNQNYLHWLQTIPVICLQSYLVCTYCKSVWAFALLAYGGWR